MIYNIYYGIDYVSTMYSIQEVINYIEGNGLKVVYEKVLCDENTVYIFTDTD